MNLSSLLSSMTATDRLHTAAQSGEVEKVLGLLQASPRLLEHRSSSDGFTVTHEAVALGHAALLAALMQQGGNKVLEARDARGRTPVHWAARVRNGALLRAMVEAAGKAVLYHTDAAGRLPIHYAAHYGHVEQMLLMIKEGGQAMLKAQDTEGDTPLHEACREGQLQVARLMLQRGEAVSPAAAAAAVQALVWSSNSLGQLATHMAAMGGHLHLLQLLVSKGEGRGGGGEGGQQGGTPGGGGNKILTKADQKGKTCAHYAAVGGYLRIMAYVVTRLGGTACSAEDEHKRGPLYYAAAEGHLNLTQYIVMRGGVELVLRKDLNGQLPSAGAHNEPKAFLEQMEGWLGMEEDVRASDARAAKDLFDDVGTDLSSTLTSASRKKSFQVSKGRRRSMQDDLTDAIGCKDSGAVAKLVEQHPRVLFEMNAYGDVPLMTAAFHGDLPACQVMVQAGGTKLLNHQNDDGETALHVATSQGQEEVALWMASVGGAELALKQAHDGQTALHYAAQRNYVSLAQGLLAAGGPDLLVMCDKSGRTVMDAAKSVAMKTALTDKVKELAEQEDQQQQQDQRKDSADISLVVNTDGATATPISIPPLLQPHPPASARSRRASGSGVLASPEAAAGAMATSLQSARKSIVSALMPTLSPRS